MKAYHSLVVFMFIVACAALSSMHSYRSAEREMVADMSQALMQTLAEKSEMTITPDTILTYRSHLRIMALREKSIVYYAMNGDEGMLSTRPMRWKTNIQLLTSKLLHIVLWLLFWHSPTNGCLFRFRPWPCCGQYSP